MAIVKAPSQNSMSLLDLSTTPAQLNGKLGAIPGAAGAAPGSFQLLFQGSMQAQGKVPASGESLPADGENLPATLPPTTDQADGEVGADSDLDGQVAVEADQSAAQQPGAELVNAEQAAGKDPNVTTTGQSATGASAFPSSPAMQAVENSQAGNQASSGVMQFGDEPSTSLQGQQPVTGEVKSQPHIPPSAASEAQSGQNVQGQAGEAKLPSASTQSVKVEQVEVAERQPRPDTSRTSPIQAEASRPVESQVQSQGSGVRSAADASQTGAPGSEQADEARAGRTQLPETANPVARSEAELRVDANKASENASPLPHPLTQGADDGAQTIAPAELNQSASVRGDQPALAGTAKPSDNSPLPGTIPSVPVTESTTGEVSDLDPVTLQARLDAVQAQEAMRSGTESRGPTQLVAPTGPADTSQARQSQLDASSVAGRGGEGAARIDLAAMSASGAGTGGTGADAEGGDSNSKQDSGAQTAAVQNAQSRTTQSVPTQAQTQAQLDAHQQLLTPRWGQAVGERMIMMAQHGPRSAQIQLDPPELGSMQIRVHVQGQDQISVSFTSANPAVRDALEQQMPRLREMLAEQGLQLSEGSISDDSSRRGQDSDSRSGSDGRAGGYAGGGGSELDAEALPGAAVAVGLVDYYA